MVLALDLARRPHVQGGRVAGHVSRHFNSGFEEGKSLERAAPHIRAVKERVGALVGVQLIPTRQLWQYDWLIDLCVNHFPYFYRELEPMPRELVGASGLGERRPAFSVS